jgi:ring-1,2-phenylacetyl-CoA epoxidase subunit PaaC
VDDAVRPALRSYLLALADDELILGHRASEWCGHAPILEEDIAFANLALDEIGHANIWYTLLAELDGEDEAAYPNRLVYLRPAAEYRSAQLVELPNGDWGFSMLRQYLFDALEKRRLERLAFSTYTPLAEAAQKIAREELYHLRHTQAWVKRLSLGTEESHARVQAALDAAWPYTAQLIAPTDGYAKLVQAGIAPAPADLQRIWEEDLWPFFQSCELALPQSPRLELERSAHTPHLSVLLADMQALVRQEPEAEW